MPLSQYFNVGIYASRNVCIKDIDSRASMVLFIVLTSHIINIVAHGVGLKCPRKIHLNTQWGWGGGGKVSKSFKFYIYIRLVFKSGL